MEQPAIVNPFVPPANQAPSLYSNEVQCDSQAESEENRQLKAELKRTRQAMRELTVAYQGLLEVSRSVTALREPEEVFRRVLNAAVTVTSAERGFLFLLPQGDDAKVENLLVAATHHIGLEEITRRHFQLSRSAIQKTLEEAAPVRIEGGGDSSQSMMELGLRAILCEPLLIDRKVLGILYLDTTRNSSFSDFHAELLRSFGAQASVCLANVRLLEARERAVKRQVEQKEKRKSLAAFLAVASRELRDPVTALTTGIRLVKSDRISEAQKATVVNDLERSIKKTEWILRSYDELRNFQSGRVPPIYRTKVEVQPLVRERVKNIFNLLGSDYGERFQVELEGTEDAVVRADRVKLSLILDCFLQNAVTQSPSGGRLVIAYRKEGDHDLIYVEDEGAAIGAAQLESIQRGEPRMDDGLAARGEQLVLFLASKLIQAHGGALKVTSGERTRFTFKLPSTADEGDS